MFINSVLFSLRWTLDEQQFPFSSALATSSQINVSHISDSQTPVILKLGE